METTNIEGTDIRNWEEKDGQIFIKQIDAAYNPAWQNDWYRNPSSGRSHNYGINTTSPLEHSTIIVKGGAFFINENVKQFVSKNKAHMPELHGGISYEMAKKEYDIAALIQEQFKLLLNKKANCPEPIDVQVTPYIQYEKKHIIELISYFGASVRQEKILKLEFTFVNLILSALKLGIDLDYPKSKEASKEIQKNPALWACTEYLNLAQQSVYRYKIQGPNTRLLDLMTLELMDRERYFMEAHNTTHINEALEKFAAKLGEFYGLLHKSSISYHGGSSEHCTLIDITIGGVVMDIGGLSYKNQSRENDMLKDIKYFIRTLGKEVEDDTPVKTVPVSSEGTPEAYIVQIFKTTNMLSYVCKKIFKSEDSVVRNTLNVFWEKYKSLYSDENIEQMSQECKTWYEPHAIRTSYLDYFKGDWITLASDLKHLAKKRVPH